MLPYNTYPLLTCNGQWEKQSYKWKQYKNASTVAHRYYLAVNPLNGAVYVSDPAGYRIIQGGINYYMTLNLILYNTTSQR